MSLTHPNRELIALGVRQPWAELIVRGTKTIEIRSQDTNVRGPIYVYASRKISGHPAARAAAEEFRLEPESLPRGVLVGTIELHHTAPAADADAVSACVPAEYLTDQYGWHVRNPERFGVPLQVRFLPYGVWFYPFKRRGSRRR
ncbi:MAG: ASCH domain-containing protein [Planctomycetes bacterium]|nr:ASCH domain-containing protein [Planctomycetota bacterium]